MAAQSGGAGRTSIWIAGLHAAKHYLFYGAGLDNFSDVYGFFAGYAPEYRGTDAASHNIYLATLVELGLAGLAIKLIALKSQLRDARPTPGQVRFPMLIAAEAAGWAIVVAAFFLNLFWRKSFWLVLIVLALSVKVCASHEESVPESAPGDEDVVEPFEYSRWYHGPSSAAVPFRGRVRRGMRSF
jgi:O-Antigen ligase